MDAWFTVLEASGHGCLAHSFEGFSLWMVGPVASRLVERQHIMAGTHLWRKLLISCGGEVNVFPVFPFSK